MNCCKNNCVYLALIVAILTGVALGVLYSLGFIATGVIFWAYVATGVLAFLLLPIYAAGACGRTGCSCFAQYRRLIVVAAIGTLVTAVAGLIVAFVSTVVVISVVLGLATGAVVFLLGLLVCLTNCICRG